MKNINDETKTTVQYRAGWLDDAGKWHVLVGWPVARDATEAQGYLEEAQQRYGSTHYPTSTVARAAKAGRLEVRSRTVTSTPWVPLD